MTEYVTGDLSYISHHFIQFLGVKICSTIWIIILSTTEHTEVNGSLQENVAFHTQGALHPEIVIVMDMGDTAKLNNMDRHILNTVQRWIKYSVPEGEAIGVAQIGAANMIHLPMTIMGDLSQRRILASKIKPVVHGESNALKGIYIAEKLISKAEGLIIILSHEMWKEVYIGTNEKRTLVNVLEKKLKIANIFISMSTSEGALNELNSHVQFLHVSENSLYVQHEMRIINTDTALEEIMAVYTSDWGQCNVSTSVIMLKEMIVTKKSAGSSNISITVFTCSQFRRLDISVHMFSGWNDCQLSHDLPECNETNNGTDMELNTLWISYPCNLTGTWTLSFVCPSTDENQRIYKAFTKVTELCTLERNEEPIKFNCIACKVWKTDVHGVNKLGLENSLCERGDSQAYWTNIHPQPVIIMSEIGESYHPFKNITIMVTIEDISGQRNPSKNNKEIIELHDGGWGADKTNTDGIYSAYFSPLGDNYDQCLNNSLSCSMSLVCTASGYNAKYGKFHIQTRGPPFQFQKTRESYPPDKIRDLRGGQEGTSDNIILLWTAAGRSLGDGRVSEYALQFMDECNNISSAMSGDQIDDQENERTRIFFHQPSTPGEILHYKVPLEDIKRTNEVSQVSKICFILEAIGESHKKTKSNCACAVVQHAENSLTILYIAVICTIILSIALLLVMCIWKRKRIARRCSYYFQRSRRKNVSESPAYFTGQAITLFHQEEQPLQGNE